VSTGVVGTSDPRGVGAGEAELEAGSLLSSLVEAPNLLGPAAVVGLFVFGLSPVWTSLFHFFNDGFREIRDLLRCVIAKFADCDSNLGVLE